MKMISIVKPGTPKQRVSLAIVAVIALGLGLLAWTVHRPAAAIDYSKTLPQSTALESHMLVFGDMYWGRQMFDWSQQSPLKEAYPFSRLHEFQRDLYDAWIANFECPAVPAVKQPIGYDPGLIDFNCDTAFLPEASKWFDIVSLGNNHIANQKREVGQEATRRELDTHGIQYFGGIDPHKPEDVCDVVSMPARATSGGSQKEVKLPVAMCGFHGVYYTITDKAIARMKEYAAHMPVIAMPHMGKEYQAVADDTRRALYQKMIDNGADMVLGNHPHWVQPTEVYKGKLIAYSMGNFIFDQQFSPEVTRSAAFDITMSLKKDAAPESTIQNWVALGDTCAVWRDQCLRDAQTRQLPRLPLTFDFDIVGVDTNDKITKKANHQTLQGILERLDWERTKAALPQVH